ncbi:MAG: outer membrane protein assembly factor BamD [Desulfobacteraceae bacterium]|nr:outer membrane protein assembly factor BamD [Desulfobacteraceae bacterium]
MTWYPASMMHFIISTLKKPVLFSLIFVLFGTGFSMAAEIDDSSLFVEAFGAYQKKDYLLAVEKIKLINQLFPDTPLQDVVLLLLARASLWSGDNTLAAKTIVKFNRDFASNPLKDTVEGELQRLAVRWRNGEKFLPTSDLRSAALKVRNEQRALEKASLDQQVRERGAAEESVPETIQAAINVSGSAKSIRVGQRGAIPFEVVNLGRSEADIVLEASAPPEYEATLTAAGRTDEKVSRVTIGPAATYKGNIVLRMPPNKVDGQKANISLRAVSEKFHRVIQTRQTQVITAAPLVRVVAKSAKLKLAPGERTRYHVTVLNVGSLPTLGMSVRVLLPAQMEFLDGDGSPYLREPAGGLIFKLDTLPTGRLTEFTMQVRVRADCPIGQELRSRIEVMHDQLPTKDVFTSMSTFVQGTQLQIQQ